MAWTIIATASFGFVFAVFARIDEVVLAGGELQPLGAERPVKAPFSGVIKNISVKEGQKVLKATHYSGLIQKFQENERKHLKYN